MDTQVRQKVNKMFREVKVEITDQPTVLAQVRISAIRERFKLPLADKTLHNWAEMAARGAFCAANSLPERTTIAMSAAETGGSDEYRWTAEFENCDNRCLLVLANILLGQTFQEQATFEGMSSEKLWCTRINISSADGKVARKRYDFRELDIFTENMYPDFTAIVRPKLSFDGTGSPRSFRRVRIEFQLDSAETQFGMLVELTNLWKNVVRNGFPSTIEDLYNGDCIIDDVTVDLFDARTLEVKVDEFGGTEAAWNPLINLLGVIRNEIARIRIF